MSIELDIDSPTRPWCKTFSTKEISIGSETVGILDFLMLAHYVLTNTDLEGDDDPRHQFLACVRAMREEEGWNPTGKRLESNIPAVLPSSS